MKKTLVLSFILLLTACNQPEPVFNKLSQSAVILAFGDSLTYGTGTTEEAAYPSILGQLSNHEVINAGIPGEISKNGLLRLPQLLDEYQPELMILIHGGNDILRKLPSSQTEYNLKQMLSLAADRNIKVVMLGVPKPNLFILNSDEIYQKISEELNIVTDLESLPKILSNKQLKSDMIHPNTQGYKLLAENIYTLLLESGAL